MIIDYAVGRLGLQRAIEASRSAVPNAPAQRRIPRSAAVRIRAARALYRLADRILPIDVRVGHSPARRA